MWGFLFSAVCLFAWIVLLPDTSHADLSAATVERTPVIVTLTPTTQGTLPNPTSAPTVPVVTPPAVPPLAEDPGNITDDCAVRIDDGTTTYESVQEAVDAAQSGATLKIAGYCSQTQTRASPAGYAGPLVIEQVALINKALTLQGGYNAEDWSETADPIAYPTVLDARQSGRALVISGSISPTIEGLRLINGDAANLGGYRDLLGEIVDVGGALYVLNASPIIRRGEIRSSTAATGGSAALIGSAALLEHNIIRSSVATDRGGGVALLQSPATLHANTIYTNTAMLGGGVYLLSSAAELRDNTIYENISTQSGGGLYLETSGARVLDNHIWGNSAANAGGGVHLRLSATALEGNTIRDNRAALGGGLFLELSNSVLNAELVQYNMAEMGGGIYIDRSNARLTNIIVTDNILTDAMGNGSGVYLFSSSPRLWHMTITRNTGGEGSGIFVTDDGNTANTLSMSNTMLLSQTVGLVIVGQSRAELAGTLWGDGIWANEAGDIFPGPEAEFFATDNRYGEPDFRSPFTGDYHIGVNSGALNRGVASNVTSDIDGDWRPARGGFDIGADEYTWLYLPLIAP
jgi:hypothetical protein